MYVRLSHRVHPPTCPGSFGWQKVKAIVNTNVAVNQVFDCISTNPDPTIRYYASDMIFLPLRNEIPIDTWGALLFILSINTPTNVAAHCIKT